MGKRIIQQARGHGSLSYRAKKSAFKYEINYPRLKAPAEGIVKELLHSPAHSSPIARIIVSGIGSRFFYNPACEGMIEGQMIGIGKGSNPGDIAHLSEIPVGTRIYNIELHPNDCGKAVRTGGSSAIVTRKVTGRVSVMMPSKKEIVLNEKCRATIGVIAGAGRLEKPIIKAGKMHHMKKARNKLWPRTSAVKMNVVDHPFGSGRGKRIKSKIAKSNAPPGARVGLIRPSKTGRGK